MSRSKKINIDAGGGSDAAAREPRCRKCGQYSGSCLVSGCKGTPFNEFDLVEVERRLTRVVEVDTRNINVDAAQYHLLDALRAIRFLKERAGIETREEDSDEGREAGAA